MMHNLEVDDMEWYFRSRGPFKKLFGCPLSSTCIYFVESSQKLDDHMVRRHHTLPSDTDLERARTREESRMSGRTSMERDLEEEVRRIVISKSGEKEETVVRLRPTDAELVSEDFLQRRPSEPGTPRAMSTISSVSYERRPQPLPPVGVDELCRRQVERLVFPNWLERPRKLPLECAVRARRNFRFIAEIAGGPIRLYIGLHVNPGPGYGAFFRRTGAYPNEKVAVATQVQFFMVDGDPEKDLDPGCMVLWKYRGMLYDVRAKPWQVVLGMSMQSLPPPRALKLALRENGQVLACEAFNF